MKELTKSVSHQQIAQLLHNKFIVVLGDSIQRSVYKDLVLLLQKDRYLTLKQLKAKGENSFEQDCLVEGGCLSELHNGTEYREVRQFQSTHHLVRFYFVTRIFSRYMQSILEDLHHGLKPDVVIVNSCVWDISRYFCMWVDDYIENLQRFFVELRCVLPEETLVIWNLTMPLAERISGGFLVPEIEHRAPELRHDVIEANFYSGTLADFYGMDVLDLHFRFRFSLHHRIKDGVHWNALAHRRITTLLLQHIAQAWGVVMPLMAVERTAIIDQQPVCENETRFAECYTSKENHNGLNLKSLQPKKNGDVGDYGPDLPSVLHLPRHRQQYKHRQVKNGFRHPYHSEPDHKRRHKYVMRSRRTRRHYAPYTHHRPSQYARHGNY